MATEKGELGFRVCRHIRSKESFYSATPLVEDEFHSGIYWCNETGGEVGDDGGYAGTEECGPDRECYQS